MSSENSISRRTTSLGRSLWKYCGGKSQQAHNSNSRSRPSDQQINGGHGNAGYVKLSTHKEEASPGQKAPPTMQLGGKPPGNAEEEALSGQKVPTIPLGGKPSSKPRKPKSIMMGHARGSLRSRVEEACKVVVDLAKKGTPHFNDFLVGNHLLMQVTPTSPLSSHCKNTISTSFNFAVPNTRSPLHKT